MIEPMDTVITFLVGVLTGIAGTYYADKLTDNRRRKEEERDAVRQFAEIVSLMPDLIAEFKRGLAIPEKATFRRFFLISSDAVVGPDRDAFYFEDDGYNGYSRKTDILKSRGYVTEITSGSIPEYRMNEGFVSRLKSG